MCTLWLSWVSKRLSIVNRQKHGKPACSCWVPSSGGSQIGFPWGQAERANPSSNHSDGLLAQTGIWHELRLQPFWHTDSWWFLLVFTFFWDFFTSKPLAGSNGTSHPRDCSNLWPSPGRMDCGFNVYHESWEGDEAGNQTLPRQWPGATVNQFLLSTNCWSICSLEA